MLRRLSDGRGVPGLAVLVLIWLGVYGPWIITTPPVDRDEARFAQASRQMFESVAWPADRLDPARHAGGLAIPMVQDRPRLNKPPLIYWLQTTSAWAFTGGRPEHDAIWMYRVPGVLCALGTILLTARLGRSLAGREAGFLAGLVLAVSPLLVLDAQQARADQLLVFIVLVQQGVLWHVYRRSDLGGLSSPDGTPTSTRASAVGIGPPLAFWAAMGLTILTKGPIGPMIAVLTVLTLGLTTGRWHWVRDLRPMLGVLVLAAMVLPWVLLVADSLSRRAGAGLIAGLAELARTAWSESAGRAGGSREHPWLPPGVHAVMLVLMFWPGSMLTALAVRRAWARARAHGERWRDWSRGCRPEAFLLAWLVPSWVVFELAGAKLPHYPMPLYPAVAIITASGLAAAARGDLPGLRDRAARAGVIVWGGVGVVIGVAGFAAWPWVLSFGPQSQSDMLHAAGRVFAPALLGVLVLAGLAWLAALQALRGRFLVAHAMGVAVAAGAMVALLSLSAPRAIRLSTDVADALGRAGAGPAGDRPIAALGYHEDSLIFVTRGRTQRLTPEQLPAWVASHPGGVIVADRRAAEVYARSAGVRPGRSHGSFLGWNLAKGRLELVRVFDATEPRAHSAEPATDRLPDRGTLPR